MRFTFLITLLFNFFHSLIIAQIPPLNTDSLRKSLAPGEEQFVIENFVNGNSTTRIIKSSKQNEINKEEQFIVRFKEPPLLVSNKLKGAGAIYRIEEEHKQFRKDLVQLISDSNSKLKSAKTKIGREYKTLINGVSVTLPSSLAEKISKFSYVSKVEKDGIVKINDSESNEAIKVPEVWNKFGFTGKGITIAIIDTGVDTAHICFSNDKFVKGFDFINNDDDPADDHSHGTHCAGIAAANSDKIKGVAPDAKIMPVKVLGQNGYGMNSAVIAGIEFAVDPDHDPYTNDGAQVISMSLGGVGNPEDAVSTAVNNAVSCGVICVVAAGNAGSQYYSIQSPGCASNAITVGSCNSTGATSIFSSRGPCLYTHTIKPDILSPGENIYSSIPRNNYTNYNGTSMATPHVAGLAALLLQKNKGWNPETVKSVIIQSAQNYKGNVLEEGSGMVNALKAIEDVLPVSPHAVDLGIINPSQGEVKQYKQVEIKNTSEDIQEITISPQSLTNLKISISGNKFILLPGETKSINVSIAINTNQVGGLSFVPIISSTILIDNGQNKYKVPVTCFIGNLSKINFNVSPDYCALYNANWDSCIQIPVNEANQSFVLNNKKTDLLAAFNNFESYILRENIERNTQPIKIEPSELVNTVKLNAFGPTGQRLNVVELNDEIRINGDHYNGFRLARFTAFIDNNSDLPDIKKQFSNISNKFCFESNLTAFPSFNKTINQLIKIPFGINQGIDKSMVLTINSSDYKKLKINIDAKDLADSIFYTTDYMYRENWSTDLFSKKIHLLNPKSTFEFYLLPEPYDGYKMANATRFSFWQKLPQNFPYDAPLLVTQFVYLKKNGILTSFNPNTSAKDSVKNDVLLLNENLLSLGNIFRNNKAINLNEIRLNGSNFETFSKPAIAKIKNVNGISSIDTLTQSFSYDYHFFNRPSDRDRFFYIKDTLSITTSYAFDENVKTSVLFQMTSKKEDYSWSDFPFKVELKGNTALNKYFLPGNNKYIAIQTLNAPTVWVKKNGEKIWEKLQVATVNQYNHRTQSLSNFKNGYYDLKLETSSDDGNSIAQWSPAFLIFNELQTDSLILVEFYKSTHGEKWINNQGWLRDEVKKWHGIAIENGRVVKIELANNNLSGSITPDLIKMDKLCTIDLSGNQLEYVPELAGIKSLKELSVQNNKLDFSSLIPNKSIPKFNYAPQDSLVVNYAQGCVWGDEIRFCVKSGNGKNHYLWYENDQLKDERDTSVYITIPKQIGTSSYKCQVTNSDLPGFSLFTSKARVFIQKREFQFESGLSLNLISSGVTGSNWIDVDNDGDEDLFIYSSEQGKSKLFINKLIEIGTVTFEECTDPEIYKTLLPVRAANWADINNDGLDDLVAICNKGDNMQSFLTVQILENQGTSKFIKKTFDLYQKKETNNILQSFNLVDHNKDNLIDIFTNHQEWINYGALTKTQLIQNNKGFADTTSNECSKYLGNIIACDILKEDGVELVDTYFSFNIYKESLNSCNPSRTIENTILTNYVNTTYAPSIGDLDNDGDLDAFVPVYNYFYTTGQFNNALFENKDNRLILRNDLSPTLKSIPYTSGSVLFDFDNDGDLDLAVSNNGQSNELYKNLYMESGKLDFEKIISESFDDEVGYWNGISVSDINMDGYLDLTEMTYQGMRVLLNQQSGNNWLSAKCTGKISNGSAIQAKVYVIAKINGERTVQYRQILSTSGQASNTSRQVHFGLGDATAIDSLIIEWPSGIVNVKTNLPVNKFMNITECLNPPVVTNLNATYSKEQIKLTWDDASFDADNYIIEYVRSDLSEVISADTIPGTQHSWSMAADARYNYYFRIKSNSNCGSEIKSKFVKSQFLTGIDEQPTFTLIYPNPASDYLFLESNEITNIAELIIFDVNGRIVLKKQIEPFHQKLSIDIHHLNPGIYTVETCMGNKLISEKIIIN